MNFDKFIGKKLIWAGVDVENNLNYLFFEGMDALGPADKERNDHVGKYYDVA